MALTIFCKQCKVGYAAVDRIPKVCPNCQQETRWTTLWPQDAHPGFPFPLTVDDRAFLKQLKIQGDTEPPTDQSEP